MANTVFLILDNGSVYRGTGFGALAYLARELKNGELNYSRAGELVFNTAMSGYYEVLTDPSYTGQIVAMCYPHMGNYGTDPSWDESGPEGKRTPRMIKAAGFVVRSLYSGPVPQGRGRLEDWLAEKGIPGISDIDTRRLTLELRDGGSRKAVFVRPEIENARELSPSELKLSMSYLQALPDMEGLGLIGDVGAPEVSNLKNDRTKSGREVGPAQHPDLAYKHAFDKDANSKQPSKNLKIAVYDCGAKANIVRELEAFGAEVILFPSTATSEQVLAAKPDGVLVSNGPGDPAVLSHQIKTIKALIGKMPVCGICLGHQLIALALGAKTYKMKFGHHGINHPVRDEISKKVFVTSQNHGFAVDEKTLPAGIDIWFRNANDQTVEGLISDKFNIACAQFHPESAPGPFDSLWIFAAFLHRFDGSLKAVR